MNEVPHIAIAQGRKTSQDKYIAIHALSTKGFSVNDVIALKPENVSVINGKPVVALRDDKIAVLSLEEAKVFAKYMLSYRKAIESAGTIFYSPKPGSTLTADNLTKSYRPYLKSIGSSLVDVGWASEGRVAITRTIESMEDITAIFGSFKKDAKKPTV